MSEDKGFAYFLGGVGLIVLVNLMNGLMTGDMYAFNVNASGRFGGSGEGELIVEYARDDGGRGFWGTVVFQSFVGIGCAGYVISYLKGKER